MQLRWSLPAAEDLERICSRIERDNPEAARRAPSMTVARSLRTFRTWDAPAVALRGRRELTFPPLPYIAVYQIKEHAVEISRIYHGAQD